MNMSNMRVGQCIHIPVKNKRGRVIRRQAAVVRMIRLGKHTVKGFRFVKKCP